MLQCIIVRTSVAASMSANLFIKIFTISAYPFSALSIRAVEPFCVWCGMVCGVFEVKDVRYVSTRNDF